MQAGCDRRCLGKSASPFFVFLGWVESRIPAEGEGAVESIDLRLMEKETILEFVVENGIDKHTDDQAA